MPAPLPPILPLDLPSGAFTAIVFRDGVPYQFVPTDSCITIDNAAIEAGNTVNYVVYRDSDWQIVDAGTWVVAAAPVSLGGFPRQPS